MFSSSYLIFAIVAVVIFTLYMSVVHFIAQTKKLNNIKDSTSPGYMEDAEGEENPPFLAQLCEEGLSLLKVDTGNQKELVNLLSRAGIESPYAVTYYLAFSRFVQPILFLVCLFLLFNLSKSSGTLNFLMHLMVILGLFVISLRGNKFYVDNLRQKRQEKIIHSFPEMLDLLLVCIESGLGLDAALNRVCKELRQLHPVIVNELDRMRLELSMLGDRGQALQNMADRTEFVSFKTLISALIQTEKLGTSLTDTLRVLSEEQRTARFYSAEQKAARIPVLITIPLICFIMPAFIMVILGPPIVRVVNQGGIFGQAAPHK